MTSLRCPCLVSHQCFDVTRTQYSDLPQDKGTLSVTHQLKQTHTYLVPFGERVTAVTFTDWEREGSIHRLHALCDSFKPHSWSSFSPAASKTAFSANRNLLTLFNIAMIHTLTLSFVYLQIVQTLDAFFFCELHSLLLTLFTLTHLKKTYISYNRIQTKIETIQKKK